MNKYSGGIYHKTQIDLTYNSNHIEGNRLNHEQTRYIFETSTFLAKDNTGTPLDDIIETANRFRCIDFIFDNALAPLTPAFIKKIHKLLKNGTSDAAQGYTVGGIDTTPPRKVASEMKALLAEYSASDGKTLDDLLEFHVRFERIHPFQDGNGRVRHLILFKE